jgi:hypothetical protein
LSVQWSQLLAKYDGLGASLIPEDIRKDVLSLIHYARQQHQENLELVEELTGARQTMLALCIQAGGVIDVPYEVVEQIKPTDVLRATDLEVPHEAGGMPMRIKRFRLGEKSVMHVVPSVN